MTKKSCFVLATGVLFALGCGYLAWTLSLGLFSIAFEILRERALEGALDSKSLLEQIRLSAWFIGVAAGAALFWRWHRDGDALQASPLKRWIVSGVAAAGATHLGYMLVHGTSVETMVSTAFLSLIAGCALAAATYGSASGVAAWLGRLAVAAICGVAILWASLAFNKSASAPYDVLGEARFVWVKIAFPQGQTRHQPKEIKVELRTASGNVKCFATAWESENGRAVLPMRCDFTELTLDREIAVTLPGEPPMVLKMPFARNPKPMNDYSGWIAIRDGLAFRYRVT
jgi:hypothetical protein